MYHTGWGGGGSLRHHWSRFPRTPPGSMSSPSKVAPLWSGHTGLWRGLCRICWQGKALPPATSVTEAESLQRAALHWDALADPQGQVTTCDWVVLWGYANCMDHLSCLLHCRPSTPHSCWRIWSQLNMQHRRTSDSGLQKILKEVVRSQSGHSE